MNARENFIKINTYEKPDALPLLVIEPIETSTIARWKKEGLPENTDVYSFLGIHKLNYLPIDWRALPGFPCETVSEDAEYIVAKEHNGCTVRRRKEDPDMYYGYIDHPVKSRADWEEYKKRFTPDIASRLHSGWTLNTLNKMNSHEAPTGLLFFPWFFRLGFYTMGMEKFLITFAEDPDWIHDMFSFWTDFTISLISPVLDLVHADFALFAEDLAYKTSTHVSPAMYREFWFPYQDKLTALLQQKKVPVICMWSAGNINPILPDLLTHGFNCTWPLENLADGMDPFLIRKKYGKKLLLGGGISKTALIDGPEAIKKEIKRLTPLIREGGYIPALDDMVPPEVPFSHYRYLTEALRNFPL